MKPSRYGSRWWRLSALLLIVLSPIQGTIPGGASLRVEDEVAPAGGLAQVQIVLTEPKPITVGRLRFRFDQRQFSRVHGAGVYSATFDLIGVGTLLDSEFLFSFLSFDGRLGLSEDVPILTIALDVEPTSGAGQSSGVSVDPAGLDLLDPNGQPYPTEVKTGSVTVGGVSITRVTPGTGTIPAGTVLRFEGVGFQPGARIDIEGVTTGEAIWVNSTLMTMTAGQTFEIDGHRIRLRNPDDSEDIYFPFTPLPSNTSSVGIFARSVPFFGKSEFTEAAVRFRDQPDAGPILGLALQNPHQSTSAAAVEVYSGDGVALGNANVSIEPEAVISVSIEELVPGVAETNVSYVVVRSARTVRVLGLTTDLNQETVTPIAATALVRPAIAAGGIVNVASFASAPVSPGSLVSIFGTGLATGELSATTVPLPRSLGGVSVLFDGIAAPLFFVSPGQINAQVPFEASGASVSVSVRSAGAESGPEPVALADVSPGLLTVDMSGSGPAIAVNAATGALVSASAPATRGGIVTIYAVGLGPVSNPPGTGEASPMDPLAATQTLPVVKFGDIEGRVLFSGLTPASVGLYQINVEIPEGVAAGDATRLEISVGGVTSNPTTIAIR